MELPSTLVPTLIWKPSVVSNATTSPAPAPTKALTVTCLSAAGSRLKRTSYGSELINLGCDRGLLQEQDVAFATYTVLGEFVEPYDTKISLFGFSGSLLPG